MLTTDGLVGEVFPYNGRRPLTLLEPDAKCTKEDAAEGRLFPSYEIQELFVCIKGI